MNDPHQARADRQDLLRLAMQAYRDRVSWAAFWRSVKHRPEASTHMGRMLKMVVSGDQIGMYAVGDDDGRMPWDVDDESHDTHTQACLQLSLPFGTAETMAHTGGSERR